MENRREFLKKCLIGLGGIAFAKEDWSAINPTQKKKETVEGMIFRSINGRPDENLAKVLDLMGGIEKFIGDRELVVIKPNVQWWNQGAPNLSALKSLVDLIMERPGGFNGEIVIAENCHRGKVPWLSAGWAQRFERNADLPGIENYNQLTASLKKRYDNRFSVIHWIDVDAGGKRVFGPEKGAGYVYCDGSGRIPLIACDNGLKGKAFRRTIMTYPVFITDKGTIVDFKNGIWNQGSYTGQPLKFINLAALNHHSTYCGFTSLVKNYLGIADLSGGPDPGNGGRLTGDYFNFHSFPFNHWGPGPEPGIIGKAVGFFMRTIRRADLNITTADWVGLASRTDLPAARTRAVLASTDPVALDYHAAKYLLYPNSRVAIHDPDRKQSPVREYLDQCAAEKGGVMDEGKVLVKSYDFKRCGLRTDGDWEIKSGIEWGTNPKALIKYGLMRFGLR